MVVNSEKNMNHSKCKIHFKCKTKCRKMLITDIWFFILGHVESTVWLKTLWFFTEDWAMYFAAVEET